MCGASRGFGEYVSKQFLRRQHHVGWFRKRPVPFFSGVLSLTNFVPRGNPGGKDGGNWQGAEVPVLLCLPRETVHLPPAPASGFPRARILPPPDMSSSSTEHLDSPEKVAAFVDSLDTFLFDCDGVIWRGDHAIPGVVETLAKLRSKGNEVAAARSRIRLRGWRSVAAFDCPEGLPPTPPNAVYLPGKRILFVSNNSTKSRASYLKKFTGLGIQATEVEHRRARKRRTAFCRRPRCADAALTDDKENVTVENLHTIQPDPSIGAVITGFDIHFNYKKLSKAFTYLKSNPECVFLATNDDNTFPMAGQIFPGWLPRIILFGLLVKILITLPPPFPTLTAIRSCNSGSGSFVAALAACTGIKPKVLGKPHQSMLDCIIQKYKLEVQRTCMVGDRWVFRGAKAGHRCSEMPFLLSFVEHRHPVWAPRRAEDLGSVNRPVRCVPFV
ncbi:MAG: HAD-like domain-containing protein [Olpidium bornovanus]|uniref:HAD-like domain-containing protein n=1 Tax=Olpidium bornovanus TaxID=278681 RepID=A0A8H8DJB4_9FUNG|nr:MAG: HAD-like domain-containing protein [Olpidium bornovanus]